MSADEDAAERVDRLLEEADDLLDGDGDAEEPAGDDDLESVVADARELFEDADTADLLDAVGVDVSEAGDPSELLPALAGADEESLVRFRRLRLLSQIEDDGDDGSALEEFEALGAVLDEDAEADLEDVEGDVLDVDSMDLFEDGSAERDDASDGEADGDDGEAAEAEEGPAGDADEAEAAEAEADDEAEQEQAAEAEADEDDGGLADQAGALKEALDEIKERAGGDEEGGPAEATDATEQSATDEDDDGDQAPASGDSRSSTRPSSDRADMRVPPRHSTMPK